MLGGIMTLLILAAGMGSRYGGLKQIDPVTDNGEFIIDFSVYDAILSGFDKIVFVIKEENYKDFKETVGQRIEDKIKVEYVFQGMNTYVPADKIPADRVKPWGTTHALLCAKDVLDDSFIVINAEILGKLIEYLLSALRELLGKGKYSSLEGSEERMEMENNSHIVSLRINDLLIVSINEESKSNAVSAQ